MHENGFGGLLCTLLGCTQYFPSGSTTDVWGQCCGVSRAALCCAPGAHCSMDHSLSLCVYVDQVHRRERKREGREPWWLPRGVRVAVSASARRRKRGWARGSPVMVTPAALLPGVWRNEVDGALGTMAQLLV